MKPRRIAMTSPSLDGKETVPQIEALKTAA